MISPFGSYPYDDKDIEYQFVEKPKKFPRNSPSKSVRRAKRAYAIEQKNIKRAFKIKRHEIFARLNRASAAFKIAKNCGNLEEAKTLIRNEGICLKAEFLDEFSEEEPLIREFRGLVTEIELDKHGALLFHVRFTFIVLSYFVSFDYIL